MASFRPFLTYLFSLPQEEKMKQMLNTLNILNLSVNVQIIYMIHIFITELSAWWFLCNVTLYKVTSSS